MRATNAKGWCGRGLVVSAALALGATALASEPAGSRASGPALEAAMDAPDEEVASPDDLSLRVALGPSLLALASGPAGAPPADGPSGMVLGELALDVPLGGVWGLEVLGRLGVTPSEGASSLLGLGLGARGAWSLGDGLEATVAVRVHHIHDAPNDAWLGETGATVAGDPSTGLAHVTAAGGAIGVSWEIPGTARGLLLTAQIEAIGRVHAHGERAIPRLWLTVPIGLRVRL